jgi:hypothetical protein
MNIYKVIQFQGFKNNETKKIDGGYLFIEAIGNIQYCRKGGDFKVLENGRRVGLSISCAKNRKEAIQYLIDNYDFKQI